MTSERTTTTNAEAMARQSDVSTNFMADPGPPPAAENSYPPTADDTRKFFQLIHPTGRTDLSWGTAPTTHGTFGDAASATDAVVDAQLDKSNTWYRVNTAIACTGGKGAMADGDVVQFNAVPVDVDAPKGLLSNPEALLKWQDETARVFTDGQLVPQATIVICSGRGIQALYVFEYPLPATDTLWYQAAVKFIAGKLNGAGYPADEKIYNPSRLMRVPFGNSVRGDSVYTIRIFTLDGPRYTKAHPFFAGVVADAPASTVSHASPVGEVIPEGVRNITFASLAGSMQRRGMSKAAIIAALKEENHKCSDPLSEGDIITIVNSIARYDPSEREPHTDLGNANRFVRRHGQNVRYCHKLGKWMIWMGTRWEWDQGEKVLTLAKQTAQEIHNEMHPNKDTAEMQRSIAKHAIASQACARLQAMLAVARPDLTIDPEALDANGELLNCENGTINLRTGQLQPHRQEDFITKICPVKYDPTALAPIFDKVLGRVFESNPTLIPYIQRAIGYAATASVKEQCLFFLYGSGENGKTTFVDAVMFPLGDYAGKADPDLLLASDGSRAHPTNVADLMGKRMVVCSETNEGKRFDEARLKDLAGETRIKARFMRQDFFEFAATHKLFLYSNHLPIVRGTDHGFWRRMKLVPFEEKIAPEEKDKGLGEKLKAEAAGILKWIVDGAVAWHRDGLPDSEVVNLATGGYRTDMDSIGLFLADRCLTAPKLIASASDLYAAYSQWCEDSGEYVWSQKRLSSELRSRGYTTNLDARTRRANWLGIGLIAEPRRSSQESEFENSDGSWGKIP